MACAQVPDAVIISLIAEVLQGDRIIAFFPVSVSLVGTKPQDRERWILSSVLDDG